MQKKTIFSIWPFSKTKIILIPLLLDRPSSRTKFQELKLSDQGHFLLQTWGQKLVLGDTPPLHIFCSKKFLMIILGMLLLAPSLSEQQPSTYFFFFWSKIISSFCSLVALGILFQLSVGWVSFAFVLFVVKTTLQCRPYLCFLK